MKRIISLILCLSLMLMISQGAFAFESPEDDSTLSRISYVNHTSVTTLSDEEAKRYDSYEINMLELSSETGLSSSVEAILSICEFKETFEASDDWIVDLYGSSQLPNYLCDYSDGLEVGMLWNNLYITYNACNGAEITLQYNDDGLISKTIFFREADYLVFESINTMGQAYAYNGLIAGESVELSDSFIQEIYNAIDEGNLDELIENEALSVEVDSTGSFHIESSYAQFQSNATGYTNDNELLNGLRSDFPEYTNVLMTSTPMYCSALGQNITINVRESRDSYVKKTANWGSFIAGTALSVIAAALGLVGGPTGVAIAATIITAVGIGISGTDTILSAVTLAKSAKYICSKQRAGYAYDPTRYYDFVRVVTYNAGGEFTGGYTANGDFTWVDSSASSSYDNLSYSTIANKTLVNYNNEIVAYGYCSNYWPD